MKFVPAVARLNCLALPGPFSTMLANHFVLHCKATVTDRLLRTEDLISLCRANILFSFTLAIESAMLPLPFREFISPQVLPCLRTVGFYHVYTLVLAFEVFVQAILQDDEVVMGTHINLLFDYLREHCISGERLTKLTCKLSWRHYCLMKGPDSKPPLWSACNIQGGNSII